jgi:hypothetical protein
MDSMDKFDNLSEEDRINNVIYILKKGNYSLAITLTSGDVLIGDPTTDLERQYLPYSEKSKDNIQGFELPISDRIVLLFPDGAGRVYGHAYAVGIPVTLIARIQSIEPLINIEKEKISFDHPGGSLALRNLPNPLSESIRDHNCEIIKRLGLRWCSYNEEALSKKAISGRNVNLHNENPLYVDWDYFSNHNGGIRSIGISVLGLGGSGGITRSNDELVSIKLHENSNYKGIIREPQEEQITTIEGDDARLYDLRVSERTSVRSMPLLIKERCTICPKEFFHQIDSELTVFGDEYSFPVCMNGKNYESYLLARAIAFIPCRGDTS